MSRRPHRPTRGGRTALVASMVLVASAGLSLAGAAPANAAFCIPILMDCSTPSPSPTPTPSATPSTGTGSAGGGSSSGGSSSGSSSGSGGLGGLLGGSGSSGGAGSGSSSSGSAGSSSSPSASATPNAQWGPATDDDTNVYTQPAAQLSGSGISIGGLPGIGLVNLRLANGSTTTAIKLTADSVTITGFSLDVRGSANGTSAVTTDDSMELKGHVVVYLDSATITLPNGKSLTLGADTPPPGGELPTSGGRFSLGLVGATADQIVHTNTDLRVRPGSGS
jgi:hypothetical protein